MKAQWLKISTIGIIFLMLVILPIQAMTTGDSLAQTKTTSDDTLNGQSTQAYNNRILGNLFILPPWGGGMVHCTPQLTDNIRLPVPTSNVGKVWYDSSWGGERRGTWGNGIAGNKNIAACSFTNYLGIDDLIIYDYDGNHIWTSSNLLNRTGLNSLATASTPMVDIHDRVIACDNWKIICVNVSNRSHAQVEWISPIPHGPHQILYPIPFSPTIVENKTVILPTKKGPLLAYDARTGKKIAEVKLGQGGTSKSYYGIPEMPLSDFQSIISNPTSAPYHYNSQTHKVEWVSSVAFGIMPQDRIFYEGNIGFMTSPDGNVTAFDNTTGQELATNAIQVTPQLLQGDDYYSTINSACVYGNRVFLVCEKKGEPKARLYALDVFPNATTESGVFREAWNFSYYGKSQASPTLIGNAIYFDGYNDTIIHKKRDPHIYAVYINNGTKKWSVKYNFTTWFSFSMDPRDGFWYEESGIFGDKGQNVVHFYTENGTVKEKINASTLIHDTGMWKNFPLIPCSCMTMCGTETNPIMLLSVNHHWSIPGKWVVAIDLANHNSVLWNFSIVSQIRLCNYANGQYTILVQNNEPRVLFATWTGGIYAVGSTTGGGQGSMPGGQQTTQDSGSSQTISTTTSTTVK
jgi:outer membrane protein assembly factor BamB